MYNSFIKCDSSLRLLNDLLILLIEITSSLQSMPQEALGTHELQTLTLDYRRECQHDDIVDSLKSPDPDEDTAVTKLKLEETNGYAAAANDGDDVRQFLHLLRLSGDGLEINRGRTRWRKKPEKR